MAGQVLVDCMCFYYPGSSIKNSEVVADCMIVSLLFRLIYLKLWDGCPMVVTCLLTACVSLYTGSSSRYSEVVALYPESEELVYQDPRSSLLLPHTVYEYRVLVFNSAGSSTSLWSSVRTYPDVPEGVSPPEVKVCQSLPQNHV